MLFRSTRGAFLDMTFEEAVFEGLAPDGGLLVPHFVPDVTTKYKEVCMWLSLYVPSCIVLGLFLVVVGRAAVRRNMPKLSRVCG